MQALGRHDMGHEALKHRLERVQTAPTGSASVDRLIGTPSSA